MFFAEKQKRRCSEKNPKKLSAGAVNCRKTIARAFASVREKKKLLCNVFPENNSFCVMARLYNTEFLSVYDQVGDYAKNLIDNKYPCAEGG